MSSPNRTGTARSGTSGPPRAPSGPSRGPGPGPMPDEEPAIPIEPEVAAARSVYIRAKIEIVKKMKSKGLSMESIQGSEEVADFAKAYPALFKMLFKIDINNEGSLRTMLAMLERMGTGQMTQDQASVVVGQRLYDTYIKTKIGEDKPPSQ
jgi:hypothetical protein